LYINFFIKKKKKKKKAGDIFLRPPDEKDNNNNIDSISLSQDDYSSIYKVYLSIIISIFTIKYIFFLKKNNIY